MFLSPSIKRRATVAIVSVIVSWIVGTSAVAQKSLSTNQKSAPFDSYYHGMFVDASRKQIKATPAFITSAQEHYLQAIGALFKDRRLQIYQAVNAKLFKTGAINALDSAKSRAAILRAWLLEAEKYRLLKPQQLNQWKQHEKALRLEIHKAFGLSLKSKSMLAIFNRLNATSRSLINAAYWQYRSRWLAALLKTDLSLLPVGLVFPDSRDYNAQCRAAGVPVPPNWGDSKWHYQGELKDEFVFGDDQALVYAYGDSVGTCIALPRKRSGAFGGLLSPPFISAFGIICQGARTENACFWDKLDSTSMDEFNGHISMDQFSGAGDDDIEQCTACHAGENAFVIHPDTPLDLDPAHYDISATWYNPIVPDSWPQNPGPLALSTNTSYSVRDLWGNVTTQAGSSCTQCHALPDFRSAAMKDAFCNQVLAPAAQRTMPPSSFDPAQHPAGWPGWFDSDSDYRVHIDRLKALCD